jgi:biopolymer transport protein ExbD
MQLTAKGPTIPIMLVLSNIFHVKASNIKKDFLVQLPSLAGHLGFSTLTIQYPSKLEQEAKAKKGVAKLMLL